jgi:SAM-dependent methyltransferase
MDTKQSYDLWSAQYDSNVNKTRDLEAVALRKTLADFRFDNCLEIGCGTGKNTEWLTKIATSITAVDLSTEMLARAKDKINSPAVRFLQADINGEWKFGGPYDIISFSLVLEHIHDLEHVFREAAMCLKPGGMIYIGELHPYKQYSGTKARFETEKGQHIVNCFNHHISDFVREAKDKGLELKGLDEHFDPDNASGIPRILTLLLMKNK